MKFNKYHIKVLLSFSVVIVVVIVYSVYLTFSGLESEKSDWHVQLLREDLNRAKVTTENPVVLAFQRKNSEKDGGLTLIDYGEVVLKEEYLYTDLEEIFFRFLEKKDIICANDVRLGFQHDGGWNVCMSPPFKLKKPCLVYSFGIGDDWRFEDDVYDYYRCKVLAFDPSIGKKEHNRTDLIAFKPYGLGAESGRSTKGWLLKSFRQHLADEGHLRQIIDYVKFDIEYMEWEVLASLVKDDVLRLVKQVAFEIHLLPMEELKTKHRNLKKQELIEKFEILKSLETMGFKKFNYRLNPFCSYLSAHTGKERSKCYELHYLNMDFVDTEHLEKRDLSHKT